MVRKIGKKLKGGGDGCGMVDGSSLWNQMTSSLLSRKVLSEGGWPNVIFGPKETCPSSPECPRASTQSGSHVPDSRFGSSGTQMCWWRVEGSCGKFLCNSWVAMSSLDPRRYDRLSWMQKHRSGRVSQEQGATLIHWLFGTVGWVWKEPLKPASIRVRR